MSERVTSIPTLSVKVPRAGTWVHIVAETYPTIGDVIMASDRNLIKLPLVGHRNVKALRDAIKEMLATSAISGGPTSACNMLREQADGLTPDRYGEAFGNARDLFMAAPWLAMAETKIGGCLNVTYADLFALWMVNSLHNCKT